MKFVWEFGLSLVNEPGEEDQYLQVFQQELGRLGEAAVGGAMSGGRAPHVVSIAHARPAKTVVEYSRRSGYHC